MQTLRIGKHDYAIGLWWQVRQGGAATRKIMLNLARETAKRKEYQDDRFNCAALRQQQYGLCCNPLPGKKLIAYSLAAAIRLTSSHKSFIGIFNFSTPDLNLWWVCAISKGIIAAEGDACFATKEDAEKAAHSLKQLFGSTEEVTCNSLEESLTYLTSRLQPENTLEPLFQTREVQKKKQLVLALLILLAVATFGGFKVYEVLEEDRLAQDLQAAQAAAEQRKLELKATLDRQFQKPWQAEPLPSHAGAQCAAYILAQPLVVQGWTLAEITCSPLANLEMPDNPGVNSGDLSGTLVVSRSHTRGAAFLDLPDNMELVSAQEARTAVKLPALPRRDLEEYNTLLSRAAATAALYDVTQNFAANLENLNWSAPETLQKEGLALISPWQRGDFTLSHLPGTAVLTPEFFQIFNQPGCLLLVVRYQADNQNWSMQGVIYALSEK